jgi:SET domain-containing protein
MSGFSSMLKDIGVTKSQLSKITHTGEVIEINSSKYHKKKSNIHGIGVFASKNLYKGETIGIGSINQVYKTTLGRYTNHSDDNNARFYHLRNNDVVMVAEKDISENDEILINYRDHVLNKLYLNEKSV